MGKFKDLTGKTFGRLTVLFRGEDAISSKGYHIVVWHCRCECGKECDVRINNLISGDTKSCGCLSVETAKKNNKRANKYDLSNSYGIGYTYRGKKFYFDLEDYNKIKDICWNTNNKTEYLIGRDCCTGKTVFMHRVIMNVVDNTQVVVDHINKNPTDNRKTNLRICSQRENSRNCKVTKNSISGFAGVNWSDQHHKWYARITIDRKNKFLGYYEDIEDAIKARQEAELKYFGEFAPCLSEEFELETPQNRQESENSESN